MPTKLLDRDPDHPACPACGTDNIFEDEGVWYCNGCGEIWEEEEK